MTTTTNAPVGPARTNEPSPAAKARKRRRVILAIQLIAVAIVLALWQVIGASRPLFSSTPTNVAKAFGPLVERDGLFGMAAKSLVELVIGICCAFVVGVIMGFLMARYRVVRVAIEPFIAAFYAVPRVAIIPVMVVWFGIDHTFVVACVIISAWVVITFSTAAGVREVGLRYYEVAHSMQITGWRLLVKILLPGSVPFIASGTKLASEHAIAAVIVAEFLVGIPGVGFVLRSARAQFDAASLFALALVLMIFGMIVVGVTTMIERRLSRWRPASD